MHLDIAWISRGKLETWRWRYWIYEEGGSWRHEGGDIGYMRRGKVETWGWILDTWGGGKVGDMRVEILDTWGGEKGVMQWFPSPVVCCTAVSVGEAGCEEDGWGSRSVTRGLTLGCPGPSPPAAGAARRRTFMLMSRVQTNKIGNIPSSPNPFIYNSLNPSSLPQKMCFTPHNPFISSMHWNGNNLIFHYFFFKEPLLN